MVSSSFLPGRGGIESYLAELCELLGDRIAVLAPPKRDGAKLPRDLPYPTHPGPNSMLWPGREVLTAIIDTARAHRTDKVVFGTPWPLVLLGPQLRDAGLRYAVIVHGAELMVPSAAPVVRRRLANALGAAELLLPVSDYTAHATERFLRRQLIRDTKAAIALGRRLPMRHTTYPREQAGPEPADPRVTADLPRVERLRARVDLARFRPDVDTGTVRRRIGIPAGAKVVLCFGRLVPRKGVDRLIEVMPEIARRVPGALLVVGGTGPEEKKLRRVARQHSAPVLFAGRVPDQDAPALYATADVFALPVVDRWFGLEIEGLGVVLLEASACATPCVTGRSGGTPEAVIDRKTGFVVDATDPAWLANAVVELLVDDGLHRSMGKAAREHVEREFSADIPPRPLLDWMS